jgi:SynChlorMet cassette protein ScmC
VTSIYGTQQPGKGLILSDGSVWQVEKGNQAAGYLVSLLHRTMQMTRPSGPGTRILVLGTDENQGGFPCSGLPEPQPDMAGTAMLGSRGHERGGDVITCLVKPFINRDMLALQMMHVVSIIGRRAQIKGGLLLHGALIEHEGKGFVLAGRGGVGKSTACSRRPSPWQARSDDSTLLVRDDEGLYRAHPWPTWTEFMFGGSGGQWNVEVSLPLEGIFFLEQAERDHVQPIRGGEAVCRLVKAAEEVFGVLSYREEEAAGLRLQRFNNICVLVPLVPCYRFQISLRGHFWQEMERVLG